MIMLVEVEEARKKELHNTFELLLPTIVSIINEGADYAFNFAHDRKVPTFETTRRGAQTIGDPKYIYNWKLEISKSLLFYLNSEIYVGYDGEFYMSVIAEVKFDGKIDVIYSKNEKFEQYVPGVKEACNACLAKYKLLHKEFCDRFF